MIRCSILNSTSSNKGNIRWWSIERFLELAIRTRLFGSEEALVSKYRIGLAKEINDAMLDHKV